MRDLILPSLVASLVACCSAQAGTPACPALKAPSSVPFLAAGQDGAATLGPVKRVPPPTGHVAVPDGPPGSVSIRLDRRMCFGTCPSYTVVIHGDGSASFDGNANVLFPGHHDFAVSEDVARCLLTHFRRADFWSLADRYVAPVFDSPRYELTLTIGGKRKEVTDYVGTVVGMPPIVRALEDEIDRVAADRWVKGTDDTLPSLRKEGFDFHSAAAETILTNGAAEAPLALVMGMIEAGTRATGRRAPPFQNHVIPTGPPPEMFLGEKRNSATIVVRSQGSTSRSAQKPRHRAHRSHGRARRERP